VCSCISTQTCRLKTKESSNLTPTPRRRLMWSTSIDQIGPSSSTSDDGTPLLNGIGAATGSRVENDNVEFQSSATCCRRQPSLLLAILRVFGPTLAQAHACELIGDILIFCGPLLQRHVQSNSLQALIKV